MRANLAPKSLLVPRFQLAIVLPQHALQPLRSEPGSLPQLCRRWLQKRVRVQRVALRMLARGNIEAETCSNQRTARLWIGIRGQHPSFVAAVAQRVHQARQVELDLEALEVDQRLQLPLRGRRWHV